MIEGLLSALRSEGLLHPGAVIVADNVLKPGVPWCRRQFLGVLWWFYWLENDG